MLPNVWATAAPSANAPAPVDLRFSSGAGTVFGQMETGPGGTHFAYSITIRKGDAVTTEYHIMNGADEIATITPNKGGVIYDICVRDGTVYRSERRGESPSSLCLVIGDSYTQGFVELLGSAFDTTVAYYYTHYAGMDYRQVIEENHITDVLFEQFSDRILFDIYGDDRLSAIVLD